MHQEHTIKTYGVVAEFDSAEHLVEATGKAREHGYVHLDAHSPFPIHGLSEAAGFKCNLVPWIFFLGGATGMLAGIGLEFYVSVLDYPLNVGGKPLFSLPSFVPIMYECTILFASLSGALGMLGLNGFPRPYHPIFSTPGFERASQDRFFLAVEASDPQFDEAQVSKFLKTLKPLSVSVVEEEE